MTSSNTESGCAKAHRGTVGRCAYCERDELLALTAKAVDVLQRHAPPDGLSDHDAMTELYGIFDGPEYRAAMNKAGNREART